MANVAPVINSAAFDQSSYVQGQTMTLTVSYVPGSSTDVETVNIVGTDTATGLPASITVNTSLGEPDPTTWTISDTKGRKYTQVSDDGKTAVFTATA